MTDKVTYYAVVNDFSSRERPAGVFRRTYTEDGGRSDEAFTRNLQWEYSTSLISAERGDLDNKFIEITEDEANQLVPIYQVSHASLVFHADTILFRLDVTSSRIQPARCHIEPVGSEVEDHLIRSGPTVRTQPDGHIADNENAHTSPGLGRPKAGQDHHRERATEPHHRLVP